MPTAFQPLTAEQYQSARNAGFSPDKIIQNEQIRKSQSTQTAQPTDNRNLLQKGIGLFLDPLINTAAHAGQAVGDLALTGINKVTGGALNKYTPEGNLSQALSRVENTPSTLPFTGTPIRPANQITPENTAGEALSTVALGMKSATAAGALIGAGGAMSQDKGGVEVGINAVVATIGGKILEHGFNAVAPYVEKAALKFGQPFVEKIAQYIPDSASKFMDTLTSKLPNLAETKILPNSVSGAINRTEQKVSSMAEAPFRAGTAVFTPKTEAEILATPEAKLHTLSAPERKFYFDKQAEAITNNTLKSNLTQKQILATPEANLHTLSPAERKFYFDNERAKLSTTSDLSQKKVAQDFEKNQAKTDKIYQTQQDKITQKRATVESKANADLQKKTDVSTKQIQDLNKEVQQTAYNKTTELKPKAVKAFGEQSQTYRTLRAEDMAPFKDTPLSNAEVHAKIDATFPESPQTAADIKARLKLNPEKTTTIGELDVQMKEMRQSTGSAAKKGNRVYTPDEMNTDKALQGMSDLLKEKGVDLSRSNKFWREWAPLRDKIVTKLKPFDVGGYETKPFSKILTDSASMKGDIHNERFISAIENTLGEPITTETRAAVAKLGDAEKSALATKLDAELKQSTIRSTSEKALADSKLAREQAIRQNTLAKETATAKNDLATQKAKGQISQREFDVKRQALDSKAQLAQAKETALKTLADKQFQVEQKAARRTSIYRIIRGTVKTGGALFLGKELFLK